MRALALIGILTVGVAASAGAQQSRAGESTEIPAQYRPPKGMCRIWLRDVPPAQQPAPTDCAAAVKNVPANGRVVYCSDCTFANPCASGGSGAIAKRLNSTWRCD